jgi:AbrB family looped-hinge helix DNA binding protein
MAASCRTPRRFALIQVVISILLANISNIMYVPDMHTKVTKRGQVSVPAEVRKKLQIGPETMLEWVVEGNTVKVFPLPADPLKAFRGSGTKGLVRRLLDERKKDRRTEDAN